MRIITTIILFLAHTCVVNCQYIDPLLPLQFEQQESVTYLIQLHSKADLSHAAKLKGRLEKSQYVYDALTMHAQKSQQELKKYLDNKSIPYQSFMINNSIKVTSDRQIFDQIKHRQDIKAIIWDKPTPMQRIESSPSESLRNPDPEWGITMIGADKVWDQGYTGQGVVLAGQDTGYDWLVSPLQTKYRGYLSDSMGVHDYNWHDAIHGPSPLHTDTINPCGFDVLEPCDDHNHGTHTMGTMVGSDTSNAIGVAPDAKWIACRTMGLYRNPHQVSLSNFERLLLPY